MIAIAYNPIIRIGNIFATALPGERRWFFTVFSLLCFIVVIGVRPDKAASMSDWVGRTGSCGQQTAIRIMPLGDSITVCGCSSDRGAYRRPLYQLLVSSGYNIDFVGSLKDGTGDFDNDHEGHSGWNDAEIASQVVNFLAANPADIVLLHIGINSLNADPRDVETILNKIDTISSDTIVVLARITNIGCCANASPCTNCGIVTQFNDNVQAMAQDRIARGDRIIFVDLERALVYPDDLCDGLHPNDSGYAKMAAAWLPGVLAAIELNGVPRISQQPLDSLWRSGNTVRMSVNASAPYLITYQWQYYANGVWANLINDTRHDGVNSPVLMIAPVTEQDAGEYQVVLTTDCGSMISQAASLTVWPALLAGDLNCDGVVNGEDLGPFALAIISPTEYAAQFSNCSINHGDLNSDGLVNVADMRGFINAVLEGDSAFFGDMNCDGLINMSDIEPFVKALTDSVVYLGQYPACNIKRGDLNGDGSVNGKDLQLFIERLLRI